MATRGSAAVVDPEVVDVDGDEDAGTDLEALASTLGIDFEFEDRPKTSRQGRPARPPTPWEDLLSGLKEPDAAGRDIRVSKFDGERAEVKSRSRAREIRQRLFHVAPMDLWDVSHRYFPEDGTWRVYAKFVRVLSKDEANDRVAKAQAVAKRLADARAEKQVG